MDPIRKLTARLTEALHHPAGAPSSPPEVTLGLAGLILLIAFVYSSIGFGGATGYLAVMAWFQIDANIAASTALSLNLVVAGIAFVNYYRRGHFTPRLLWPFVITSIPSAFLGGMVRLQPFTYLIILHSLLLLVAIRLLTDRETAAYPEFTSPPRFWLTALIGAVLGFVSGMIGIGGGIFLSPIIILAHWGNPKQAASTSSGFIFLNSASGLIGRVIAGSFTFGTFGLTLIPIGIVGSLLGSSLGSAHFSGRTLKRILAVVLLVVIVRFILRQLI
jgi:uncharacterized membrane protein YfcA